MPTPAAPLGTPVLDQLIAQLMPIAQKLGITSLVITGRDPQTKELALFGSVESMTDVRDFVETKMNEKCGMIGETAWE